MNVGTIALAMEYGLYLTFTLVYELGCGNPFAVEEQLASGSKSYDVLLRK